MYIMYSVHCVQCKMNNNLREYCTMRNAKCTLYSAHYTLYIVQCTLYIIHCTMYSVFKQNILRKLIFIVQ